MISNMCLDKFRHSHALIIIIIMLFLSQCVKSSTTPTSLGYQQGAVLASMNKQIKCIDKERQALVDFKAMNLPDPLGCFSAWPGTKKEDLDDCCKWRRVTCNNQTGHVTRLVLFHCGLRGEISPSLLNLTYLNVLDLSYNSFNGTIPRWIGSLTELRELDLSYNSFSGNIPLEFGNLVKLEILNLEYLGRCSVENITWLSRLCNLWDLNMNGISLAKADHWVNAVLSLQKLTVLSLDGCDLSQVMHPYSSFSSHINSSSYSSNMIVLSLSNNNLNSSMFPWLYPLTGDTLFSLDLSGNKLDEIPKYLGNLCGLYYLYFIANSAPVTFSDFLKTLSAGCTSDTLQVLNASSSQLTGSIISDDIRNFSSLEYVYLAHNQLNGSVSEIMRVLPIINVLDVSSNSLRCDIFEKSGKSKLTYYEYVTYLNMANNGISDTIPTEFWETWPYQFVYLNLSSNNISGKAPDILSSFDGICAALDLSSNNFYGSVTKVSSKLNVLNVSKNKFYGGISFLCQNVDSFLTDVDLSHNSFSGQIPDCLWHLKYLKVLNLAHNNLSGRLPASIEHLFQLEVLSLYNNFFSGELPLSMRNCTSLTFLDLGGNSFSGNVPVWIGENLLRLYVLSLGSNDFFGPIPLQLCQLVNLQILDLSINNLNGTIPSCVNNFTSMVKVAFLSAHNVHEFGIQGQSPYFEYGYTDNAMVLWQGIRREFINNLRLLKSIDLSSNNLTGQIPNELTDLHGLLALNLSSNALFGEIPHKIGQVKELLTLDLSRNHFSGRIPPSISEMTSLNCLDLSYNNLSGRIPSSTQLQSFNATTYTGNAGLCGLPLSKYCPGDEDLQVPSPLGERDIDELERWFYIGGAIGFAIGFWIACITLLVNRRGRHTFFHFLDTLED